MKLLPRRAEAKGNNFMITGRRGGAAVGPGDARQCPVGGDGMESAMTVLRGLWEAAVLLVIALVVVAVAAGVWVAVSGGDFVDRLGVALIAVGALLGVTNDLTLSRIGMLDARSAFGLPPEQDSAGGGRVLTGVGVFLFVGLPLVVAGIVLVS
jgi:hypothetical protein